MKSADGREEEMQMRNILGGVSRCIKVGLDYFA